MEITVSSRHTEVSDLLRESTVEKIGRLGRFLEGMDRAEVHFSEEHTRRVADKEVCEVTLVGHGHRVRCKVAAPDGFAAVDLAVEKLEHQLHKLKTKLLKVKRNHEGHRRGAERSVRPLDDDDLGGEDLAGDGLRTAVLDGRDGDGFSPRIVKTKTFQTKPMTPQEAALQMDLLGHDFFLFVNRESGSAAVLYRRHDGHFGLIETSG